MFDVRIINGEAVLLENDVEVMNLEPYRNNGDIRYTFDDGSSVRIWYDNSIAWFDPYGKLHREFGPAIIYRDGYSENWRRYNTFGSSPIDIIHDDGKEEYWLYGKRYTKNEFEEKMKKHNI